jgi:hypothetical protein
MRGKKKADAALSSLLGMRGTMTYRQLRLCLAGSSKVALWPTAVLIGLAAAGCNPYRAPQTIDPETELRMSEKSIAIGSAMLRVPHGWTAETVERFDEDGQPLSVSLVRCDKRGRIAYMLFEVVEDRPIWRGNAEVSETSTKRHERVVYDVTDTQEPSGDDTPGHFTICAYAKADNQFWYMYVSFFTPVRPDLIDAVNYIDAIVPDGKGESVKKGTQLFFDRRPASRLLREGSIAARPRRPWGRRWAGAPVVGRAW